MIKVYDVSMHLKAVLQNAFAIGYEKRMNELWSATFSLPANDPKNAECLPFRFVELFEGGERVDLFRILPNKLNKGAESVVITYQCEHVLGTLLDDILFQYHQTTNETPTDTMQYILDEQSIENWVLGDVDFSDLFSYKWENENLLAAIYSVPRAYSDEYLFTWDTTVYPWILNMIQPESTPSARIMYRKNLVGITKDEDPTNVVTRLYPLGYGEGVNQLDIRSVNSDVPYIDADTIGTYGVIARPFVDKTEENASTLKAKAEARLNELKSPKVTYTVDAAELYQISQDPLDKFESGALVSVSDVETGLQFTGRVKVVTKSDIKEKPWEAKLEISNKVLTVSDSYTAMLRRQNITDLYSQGAVNIDSDNQQDNCDATHPIKIEFYLSNDVVRVNKCLLTYKTGAFRAYETGAASGGGTTSGPSSANTTGQGGSGNPSTGYSTSSNWNIGGAYSIPEVMQVVEGHAHGLVPHQHTVSIPNHTHGMDHTHAIPAHTHDIIYGIYENPITATAVTVKVDGNTIPGLTSLTGTDIDIIPYLSLDGEGKINRGAWHTVEITPNNLARITAAVVKQLFLQSRGGGDY